MKEFRGISGPWKISHEPCRVDQDGINISTDWEIKWDGVVSNFITVWGNNETCKKTAKLIVASPDLLEALQKCVKILNWNDASCDSVSNESKLAINKALGL